MPVMVEIGRTDQARAEYHLGSEFRRRTKLSTRETRARRSFSAVLSFEARFLERLSEACYELRDNGEADPGIALALLGLHAFADHQVRWPEMSMRSGSPLRLGVMPVRLAAGDRPDDFGALLNPNPNKAELIT
jgi:hypothetical protein